MNKIDDILESLKGQQPVISAPDELTDRIMDSLPDIDEAIGHGKAPVVRLRWWMAVAASLIIIIGIGAIWMFDNKQPESQLVAVDTQSPIADADYKSANQEVGDYKFPTTKNNDAADYPVVADLQSATKELGDLKSPTREEQPPIKESAPIAESNPNLHYAVYTPEEDSTYQAPSRMDEFITKLASYNEVKAVPLNCSYDPSDSTIVSTAYVFEDKQELNLFGRLLQAACWYDSKTPGYLLNFSHQQFFFTLKDLCKNEKYLWIAERITGNRILLFSSHSPIEANVSSVCYQNYLQQLMHPNYNTSQF